jgi:hypothetical protein
MDAASELEAMEEDEGAVPSTLQEKFCALILAHRSPLLKLFHFVDKAGTGTISVR